MNQVLCEFSFSSAWKAFRLLPLAWCTNLIRLNDPVWIKMGLQNGWTHFLPKLGNFHSTFWSKVSCLLLQRVCLYVSSFLFFLFSSVSFAGNFGSSKFIKEMLRYINGRRKNIWFERYDEQNITSETTEVHTIVRAILNIHCTWKIFIYLSCNLD